MLTPPYCVALYSATQCLIHSKKRALSDLSAPSGGARQVPTAEQLTAMQEKLHWPSLKRPSGLKVPIVVLVPDHWLSIIDHKVPKLATKVAPLAALSVAAEHIFCPPEQIYFAYRQYKQVGGDNVLKVFACSEHWYELLCQPFLGRGQSVLLMSYWQYQQAIASPATWRWCKRFRLAKYQPLAAQQRQLKVKLYSLLVISLALHGGIAMGYVWLAPPAWSPTSVMHPQQPTVLSEGLLSQLLTWLGGLSAGVHLLSLQGDAQQAQVTISLPAPHLAALLNTARREQPDWLWQAQVIKHHAAAYPGQVEVVDAQLSIRSTP